MISKTGVEIDTTNQFLNPETFEQSGTQSTIAVTGLNSETTYYVRAYVIQNGNTIYSTNVESFTTLEPTAVVTISSVSNITSSGATINITIS